MIAPSVTENGGNCAGRALSIMRLALGYTDHADILVGGYSNKDIIEQFGKALPDHRVTVVVGEESIKNVAVDIPDNVTVLHELSYDDDYKNLHLWAFAYTVEDHPDNISHLVIGHPVAYGDMIFRSIIAVELKKCQIQIPES